VFPGDTCVPTVDGSTTWGFCWWYHTWLGGVPGYTGVSYFLNVPVLVQKIFQAKTGQAQ
jgi:hypothetical protein